MLKSALQKLIHVFYGWLELGAVSFSYLKLQRMTSSKVCLSELKVRWLAGFGAFDHITQSLSADDVCWFFHRTVEVLNLILSTSSVSFWFNWHRWFILALFMKQPFLLWDCLWVYCHDVVIIYYIRLVLIMVAFLRRVWTVSAAAARTPTWPTERRSWRPSPCRRKLWNRLVSRLASTSPVSPRRPSVARPPAPPTPSSTSPRLQGHPSQPPSYRGRGTTTGALTIHWRCGLTAEVSPPTPVSRYAHSPPASWALSSWACQGPAVSEPEQGSYSDRR